MVELEIYMPITEVELVFKFLRKKVKCYVAFITNVIYVVIPF